MVDRKFVSYLRVSTAQQGTSGLGLEAQRAAVAGFLNGGSWTLIQELVEVESGKRNDRPALERALRLCRKHRATLVVAKLDRLARNAEFLLKTVRESGEGRVVFCDLPTIPGGPVGDFIITQMAGVAQLEAGLISQRTKAALAAAKARGTKLGGRRVSAERFAQIGAAARQTHVRKAERGRAAILPVIEKLQSSGIRSLRQIAAGLDAAEIPTPRGQGEWSAVQVQRILKAASIRKLPFGVAAIAKAAVA